MIIFCTCIFAWIALHGLADLAKAVTSVGATKTISWHCVLLYAVPALVAIGLLLKDKF